MTIGTDMSVEQLHTLADHQRSEIERLQAELAEARERAVRRFVGAILHGDSDHRDWLIRAGEAFISGNDMPPPTGKGRADTAEADAARLRAALEKIACPTQSDNLLWWQEEARQALATSPAVAAAAEVIRAAVEREDLIRRSYQQHSHIGNEHIAAANEKLRAAVAAYTAATKPEDSQP